MKSAVNFYLFSYSHFHHFIHCHDLIFPVVSIFKAVGTLHCPDFLEELLRSSGPIDFVMKMTDDPDREVN